jgi:hypothetical protein
VRPAASPNVPGNTPWEKMDNAVRKVLGVPKDALLKAEAKSKRKRARKKAARQKPH